ncbi:MAG: hypothetical protein M1834_007109 [Cirrosporium novae-zelandiae]|nr:MAG: hypothetical protein M1834_007109 [Cirrosporium novae-zelandiae]
MSAQDQIKIVYPCTKVKLLGRFPPELVEKARKDIEHVVATAPLPPPSAKNAALFFSSESQGDLVSQIEVQYQKITLTTKQLHHSYGAVFFEGDSIVGTKFSSIVVPLVVTGSPVVRMKDPQKTSEEDHENIDWNGSEFFYVGGQVIFKVSGNGRLGALVVSFER